jgi:hypothetical protein
MGTFAETATVVYHSWFANQSETNFHIPFPFAANKQKFDVSVLADGLNDLPIYVTDKYLCLFLLLV